MCIGQKLGIKAYKTNIQEELNSVYTTVSWIAGSASVALYSVTELSNKITLTEAPKAGWGTIRLFPQEVHYQT